MNPKRYFLGEAGLLWAIVVAYALFFAYVYFDHIVFLANMHAWSESKPKPYVSKFWIANWE